MRFLASLYLESFFLFAVYSLNIVFGIYLFIFIFQNLKLFASHNHLPRSKCPGLPCTLPASVAPQELPVVCLGLGAQRGRG